MNKALVLLFLFFIGSLIGWVIELFFRRFCSPNGRTTKKWVNPGFLVGPYLPLYGSGLCVLYMLASINLSFLDEHPIIEKIVLFVFMAIAMTVIEYITGLIFIKGMKKNYGTTQTDGAIFRESSVHCFHSSGQFSARPTTC